MSSPSGVINGGASASASSSSSAPLISRRRPKPSSFAVYLFSSVTCIAAMELGYASAVMSPCLAPIQRHWGFSTPTSGVQDPAVTRRNSVLTGATMTAILVGGLAGAMMAGSVADRFGRFAANLATELVYLAGSVVCALAQWLWLFVVGRVVTGVGLGLASVAVLLMIMEVSPQGIRGQVGVLNQLSITVGILLAYLAGFLCVWALPEWLGWRVAVGVPAVTAAVHLVLALLLFRLESPRWLVKRGRLAEAKEVIRSLRGSDLTDFEVEEEVHGIRQEEVLSDDSGGAKSSRVMRALLKPTALPIVLAVGLMLFQQITGINAVLYYLSPLLTATGFSTTASNVMSVAVGGINVLMTVVSVTLIDRLGRRPLLLASLSGMVVTLLTLGVVGLVNTAAAKWGSIISVCAVLVYVMSFAVGLGACPWPIINEMFRQETRAPATSISLAVNWLGNIVVTLVFPLFWLPYCMLVFAGLSVVTLLFIAILLPETKGKTVTEIESALLHKSK